MNPVVHFELPCDNRARMATLHENAFGWQAQMPGEEMNIPGAGQYVSFMDTEGNRVSMLEPVSCDGKAST